MSPQPGNKRKSLPSIIETTSARIRSKWIHFSHRLSVDEFVTLCRMEPVSDDVINSPKFFPSSSQSIKFYLKLYPSYHKEPNHVAIFLHLSTSSSVNQVITKYRLSLIDRHGEYRETIKSEARPFKPGDCWGFPTFLKRSSLLRKAEVYLPENQLTVCCEVSCLISYEETNEAINALEKALAASYDQTMLNYSNLLENGLYADVQLLVNGTEFRVHKSILSIQSPVFASLLINQNYLEFNDVNSEVFGAMLKYIYSGKVNEASVDATKLLSLAHRYKLNHLKQICELLLCSKLSISTAVDLLNLANSNKCDMLKDNAIDYIKENISSIMKTDSWNRSVTNQSKLFDKLFGSLYPENKRSKQYIKQEELSFD